MMNKFQGEGEHHVAPPSKLPMMILVVDILNLKAMLNHFFLTILSKAWCNIIFQFITIFTVCIDNFPLHL